MTHLTWDFALFVGGFVAALFFLAAALVYVTAPGNPVLGGLTLMLGGLGGLFLAIGVAGAAVLWWLAGRA